MATYLDMLDAIGLIVGGTAPDSINTPHFFSGTKTGDGTGLTGLKGGCWSVPPAAVAETPAVLLLADDFKVEGPEQSEVFIPGNEWDIDSIRMQVLVSLQDHPTSWALADPFRDSLPNLFNSHMRLSSTAWPVLADGSAFPFVLTSKIVGGKAGTLVYADTEYIGWEMTLRIWRMLQPIYTP